MKSLIEENGFFIQENVFNCEEVKALLHLIGENKQKDTENFRARKDLYAIRNLFQEVPEVLSLVMNYRLRTLLSKYFGKTYFPVKGIYFDKPPLSSWFVNWHQDLTISVNKKSEHPGFKNWTMKSGQQAVQPSVEYLEDILTVRIHLDDTDEGNGALHVVPGSHAQGVIEDSRIQKVREELGTVACNTFRGGVMFMKPLILHASYKSVNENHRRVLHLEFSSKELPAGMMWRERPVKF